MTGQYRERKRVCRSSSVLRYVALSTLRSPFAAGRGSSSRTGHRARPAAAGSGPAASARDKLLAVECSEKIHCYRSELAEADDLIRVRLVESRAAAVYWSAWRSLPVVFPTKDQRQVPVHWRPFGTRVSPLSGSPRLAVNPPNAILNYLYSLLESEARLAAAALGPDPGLGVLHVDTKARDSLACDLIGDGPPSRGRLLARLDHARATKASVVFRNARW
jgi:hypothetical protein